MYLASNNGIERYTIEKTPECLSNELTSVYKKQGKNCDEKLEESIRAEAQLVFSQLQKYECFYQQSNKDYSKYSPLKFISKQDPKKFIEVGTILAIPKNPEGSLIVEIIVNGKPVVMGKKSGEDTWREIEVDAPTQNGFRVAAILSQNKESVEIFANAYVDDLKMMVPLSKQIKNIYLEVMDQRSKGVEKKPSLVVSR